MNAMDAESTDSREPRRNTGTQSVERVVALLRALTPHNKRGSSAAELGRATGVDRTTAHRILKCLAQEQLLSFDPESRRYRFGPLVSEMSAAASEVLDLPALCRPALARIADDVGDTVFLMVRRGDEAVCAERLSGTYPVKTFVVDVGVYRPLGVGAGSMAILAALPPDVADLLLEHNEPRFAQYPDVSMTKVRALMQESRQRGYVDMDVVGVEGVRAVGVAVKVGGRPVAALSIAAISVRMTGQRTVSLAGLLQREADTLGQLLEKRLRSPHDEG